MKRPLLLSVMLMLVVWLARGAPRNDQHLQNRDWFISRAAAPQDCCTNPGETDPHDECIAGACVSVSGCGVSDCSTCGCDPFEELNCIVEGGFWDPNLCVCTYIPICDPDGSQESACVNSGGRWDSGSCTCEACSPILPYPVGPVEYEYFSYCDGDYWVDCVDMYQEMVLMCDETEYGRWTEWLGTFCDYSNDYCGWDPCGYDPYLCCYWDYCS